METMDRDVERHLRAIESEWVPNLPEGARDQWTLVSDRPGSESLDGAVAVLCRVSEIAERVAFVLRPGRNEIGRSCGATAGHSEALKGVVEGFQWLVECAPHGNFVSDDRSSNGSILLRGRERSNCMKRCELLRAAALGIPIGWDGTEEFRGQTAIESGDVLVGYYEPFLFVPLAEAEQLEQLPGKVHGAPKATDTDSDR